MKKVYGLLVAGLITMGTLKTEAQGIVPQLSSGQTIVQDLGLGKVTLTYSRPNTKGRKMLGGMEPYGTVWRTGANAATIIKFTDDVSLNGNKIPAGEYGLFSIPGPNEWTIILNKTAKQWGAYDYKQADDVIRFKVKPGKSAVKVETLTMQFANVTTTDCDLQLTWENTLVSVHLMTDIDAKVMANIENGMKAEKKPYFDAAQYYYLNNKDLTKALEWMTILEKANPKVYYFKLWKARIQLKMGDKAGAITTAQEGLVLAKADKSDEYVRLHEAVLKQAKG